MSPAIFLAPEIIINPIFSMSSSSSSTTLFHSPIGLKAFQGKSNSHGRKCIEECNANGGIYSCCNCINALVFSYSQHMCTSHGTPLLPLLLLLLSQWNAIKCKSYQPNITGKSKEHENGVKHKSVNC